MAEYTWTRHVAIVTARTGAAIYGGGGRRALRQNDKGCAQTWTNQREVDRSRRSTRVDGRKSKEVDLGMWSTTKKITDYLNHDHYHVSSYLFFTLQ